MNEQCLLHRLPSILNPFALVKGARFIVLLAVFLGAGMVQAAAIYVDGLACQLQDAIIAANTDQTVFGCTAGAGADTLVLTRDVKLQLGDLPSVTSDITIEYGDFGAQTDCNTETTQEPPPDDPPGEPPLVNDPPPDGPPVGNDDPPLDDPPTDVPQEDPTSAPSNTATPRPSATATPRPSSTATALPTSTATAPPPTIPELTLTATHSVTFTGTPSTPTDFELTQTATHSATLTGTPSGTPTDAPGIPAYCLHTVARGETLFRIALQYQLTVQEISNYNNLPSVNRLGEGQELIIPHDECLQYAAQKG